MVHLTEICSKYMPFYLRRPETRSVYFRRQAIFRLTGTFYGRNRNVWRCAVNKWLKRMVYLKEFRQRQGVHLKDLYAQRLLAAIEEHDLRMEHFMSILIRIELDIETLSLLATYEPRTFKSLVDLARTVLHENDDSIYKNSFQPSPNVFTREMIKDTD
ncbi:ABC transporter G [Sarcoptes scabiei]|uniref:39S ribosomal protein L20, mitochondrial-like protein n=1 Tax=Sarcoptes scabiei TaxID=52283 RepID=A0A132A159_SARSC|nr:39S ribosomal protein L20, mitochondrial-like protein [Sarcoptes scabiei]UXI19299.1 ABC transporter G [Sarcoptes scabiei]